MSRFLAIMLTLVLVGQALAEPPNAGKADLPQHLMGDVNGEHLWLYILPEDEMQTLRKLEGTRLINVEPGCILLEAYCELIGDKRLKIRMPLEGYFTKQAMLRMGVSVKDMIVEFQPSDSPTTAGKIVGISPFKEDSSEQGLAPQSATRSELNSESNDKPHPESEPRPR